MNILFKSRLAASRTNFIGESTLVFLLALLLIIAGIAVLAAIRKRKKQK